VSPSSTSAGTGSKPDGGHEDGVVLDMDYWVALPR